MKQIISKILLAFPIIAALAGCMSQMDIQNDGRMDDMKEIFEQQQRVNNFINDSFYNACYVFWNGFGWDGLMLASMTDEAEESDLASSAAEKWYDGKATSFESPVFGTLTWDRTYNTIFKMNQAIYYLSDSDLVIDYKDEERTSFLAHAYALRAYMYLELFKRYGGVPIVARPYSLNHDYSADVRASAAQVADFILASCDSSLNATSSIKGTTTGFEWRVSSGSNEIGRRMTRAVVYAVESETALLAASPLWCDDHAGTEQYTWDRACSITKTALDEVTSHGYSLFNSSTAFPVKGVNIFDSYFLSEPSFGGGWDKETIYSPFESSSHTVANVAFQAGLPITEGQTSSGACPTQEMVDCYEVLSPDGSRSANILDLAKPYNQDGTPNISSKARALGYEDCTYGMYENRDPRFYATIFYNGSTCGEKGTVETYVGGNCGITNSTATKRYTRTGYYLRKYQNPETSVNANYEGYGRSYRLAQLYLNFAEAAFKSSYGADGEVPATADASSSKGMSSRDALNTIRERAGMPDITEAGDSYWARYVNERRVELAFEEQRYYDVRRWQRPDGDLSSTDRYVSGMNIDMESDGSFSYSRFRFPERECYTNKYLKNPIYLDEVQRMQKLTGTSWQNPGWEM